MSSRSCAPAQVRNEAPQFGVIGGLRVPSDGSLTAAPIDTLFARCTGQQQRLREAVGGPHLSSRALPSAATHVVFVAAG